MGARFLAAGLGLVYAFSAAAALGGGGSPNVILLEDGSGLLLEDGSSLLMEA